MAIRIVTSASGTMTASQSPSITFSGYVPNVDDVVVMYASVMNTGAAINATPSGWVNPFEDIIESDAHTMVGIYHIVTTAEETAVTTTYTASNVFTANQTGDIVAAVLRGVDTANPIDDITYDAISTNTSPHIIPGALGTNVSMNSFLLTAIAKDGTGTYTTPTGWTQILTSNVNLGVWLGTYNELTTIGTTIPDTNITPSVADESAAITYTFNEKRTFAPKLESIGTMLTGAASTTADIPVPAGVVKDDIVMVYLYVETTQAVTPAAGFAAAPNSPAVVTGSNAHNLHVFWKRATGADAGTYSFTIAAGVAWRQGLAMRYSGCVLKGSPFDVTTSAIKTTTTTNTSPAVSITTTGSKRLIVWFGTHYSSWTTATLSGFTERFQSPNNIGITIDTEEQPVAGSTGSLQTTFSGNGGTAAWLGALKPRDETPFFNMFWPT